MSQAPMRIPAGFTQANYNSALGSIGAPDPTFMARFFDDFTQYAATSYTVTATGTGTAARAAGNGGLLSFTTNATTPLATDIVSLQQSVATHALTKGNKLAFTSSFIAADVLNPALILGAIQTTATPFTVTDGIWFSKASGASQLTLNHAVGGVTTSALCPITLVNNTQATCGFYLNPKGEIEAYVTLNTPGQVVDQNRINLGPQARIIPPTLTSAVLNPTLAIQSGTASSKVVTFDWVLLTGERIAL